LLRVLAKDGWGKVHGVGFRADKGGSGCISHCRQGASVASCARSCRVAATTIARLCGALAQLVRAEDS
jgi:hypothetical protein